MGFGTHIKLLREKAGITSDRMAILLGLPKEKIERYRNWEKRDGTHKAADLNKIEQIFDLTLDQILRLESLPKYFLNQDEQADYLKKRRDLKNNLNANTLTYYDVNAAAGKAVNAEILPVPKSEGVLHISDLFKGSQFAIRISGNSMMTNYPSGAIIGIREIQDKQITPGSVYVIEKDSDLWIKRLFYKDDNQSSGILECVSDNEMRYEKGPRQGKLYYPPFYIEVDKIRKLFKVTGIYKSNELTVINS